MAPLIDCVFLLLIFFLVATTLKEINRELPIELPQMAAAVDVSLPDDLMVVGVDPLGQFYLDGEPITQGLLVQSIRAAAALDPTRPVRIDADRNAPFQAVIQAYEHLRLEGMTNVNAKAADRPLPEPDDA
jgi:biopolymer transport protein ExbD